MTKFKALSSVAIMPLALAVASPVFAQAVSASAADSSASDDGGEIIVTAQGRAQSMQDLSLIHI